MRPKLIFVLFILFFSSLTFAQDSLAKLPVESIVFEGKVVHKEGIWASNRSTIYTVNWFTLDAVYNGNTKEITEIPIVTEGGGNEFEFVIVNHADYFYENHKYIVAVEPCTDCIEGMTVYVPISYVGDFNPENIVRYRNTLQAKSRIGLVDDKNECKEEEEAVLHISLGNINLEFDGALIHGKMDINTKTNVSSKALVKLLTQIKYDTTVFSGNAIVNQNITPSFSQGLQSSSIAQSYNIQSQDISPDQAGIGIMRNPMNPGGNFIIVNTLFQSTMSLNFSLPLSMLSNLPNQLENLLEVIQVEASFLCNGRERTFDKIIFENRTIGLSYAGSSGEGGITYSFETIYDYNASRYFVEVYASSTVPSLLLEGSLIFNYNTDAFFPSQHTNGHITGIAGMMLNNFNFIGSSDIDESTLRIDFSADNLELDELLEINSNNTFLFEFSMLMNDCQEPPNLTFDEAGMQNLSFCVDQSTFPIPIVYDVVNASDSDLALLCNDCAGLSSPQITGWHPAEIIAGDNQILTIMGDNFGEAFQRSLNPGDGGTGSSVLFYNGDYVPDPNGNPTEPEFIAAGREDFNINDIIEWSNTMIKVKVPSTDYDNGTKGVASTGLFMVRNGCNLNITSNDNLKIPYALINYREEREGKAFNVGLRNNDNLVGTSEDGYEFEFDPSTDSSTGNNIKDIFGSALSQWCSATNIRFKQKAEVNTESATDVTAGDGKSLVIVAPLANPNAGAAVLYGSSYFQISCGVSENDPDAGFLLSEVDLVVNGPQALSLSAEELEHNILHELGHAHMLAHARCPRLLSDPSCTEPLMHPTSTIGADNITTVDNQGANRVFSTSSAIIGANNCRISSQTLVSVSSIEQGGCGTMTSTNEIDISTLKIYPNPTSGIISIEEIDEFANYFVHDFNGKILLQGKNSSNKMTLDLSILPSGIYFLVLQGEIGIGYLKLIKL